MFLPPAVATTTNTHSATPSPAEPRAHVESSAHPLPKVRSASPYLPGSTASPCPPRLRSALQYQRDADTTDRLSRSAVASTKRRPPRECATDGYRHRSARLLD